MIEIESWRFKGTCCHLDSCKRKSINTGVKNLQEEKTRTNYIETINKTQQNYKTGWEGRSTKNCAKD